MDTLELARVLKETAKLVETEFAKKRDHTDNLQMNMSIRDAARKVCGNAMWFPVYLLLDGTWNDALDWADNPQDYDGNALDA